MKKLIAITIAVTCATQIQAKFTQQSNTCPSGQFLCDVDGYKWCCDNNPEESGGCSFWIVGNRGCCTKHNTMDGNCGHLDV